MNPVLVLFLDTCRALPSSNVWVTIGLSDLGRTCETDSAAWCHNVFSPSPNELESLQQLALQKEYDLIIVGNNNGTGMEVVAALPPTLRSKVIIVANTLPYHPREAERYTQLGVKELSVRSSISEPARRLLTPA